MLLEFCWKLENYQIKIQKLVVLTLYKAQIRHCLEYSSHKHSLATLCEIQKKVITLINDPTFAIYIDALAHQRLLF